MALFNYLPSYWLWFTLVGGVAFASYLFIVKTIRHRRFYSDLPTPPHSLLLGNLAIMGEYQKRFPSDCHPQPLFTEMAKDYGFRGIYYVDLYPFAQPLVLLLDPAVSAQAERLPRHQIAFDLLRGVAGTKSLFSVKGKEWLNQHNWFMPAFSISHIMTLVPVIVEETLIFREKLTKRAVSGEIFSMNKDVINLTIDVIARTTFDLRIESQTKKSPIFTHFQGAISWAAGQTDPVMKRILSPYMMYYHTSRLDAHLAEYVKKRAASKTEDNGTKTILDLALKGFQKETGKLGKSAHMVDPEFMKIAVDNSKLFLAGGHDTTASLITYAFHLLSLHPEVLARVRQEHDEVFGTTLQATIDNLKSDPHRLNKITLTLNVLKETLRLFPPGFTVRTAPPGTTVVFEGRTYPIDNHMICTLNSYMQRNETIWDQPTQFNPDRWSALPKGATEAWQPFSRGPQRCIGSELSFAEAKVVCVMVLRWFDFETTFTEKGPSIPNWGDRAYQELELTAKPKDGIPMRLRLHPHD